MSNTLDMEGKRVYGMWRGKPFTGTVWRCVVIEYVERGYDRIGGAYNDVERSVALVIDPDKNCVFELQRRRIEIRQQDIDDGISTVEVSA